MILFAPTPPEMVFAFTPEQMARLDRRFARLDTLPADPDLLVRDSALLLDAFVTLHIGDHQWEGRPDQSSELPQLTETTWEERLALQHLNAHHVTPEQLPRLLDWPSGAVYIFGPFLKRHYRLTDELDRLELEFLLQDGLPSVQVLRAHRLEADGTLTLWRANLRAWRPALS